MGSRLVRPLCDTDTFWLQIGSTGPQDLVFAAAPRKLTYNGNGASVPGGIVVATESEQDWKIC